MVPGRLLAALAVSLLLAARVGAQEPAPAGATEPAPAEATEPAGDPPPQGAPGAGAPEEESGRAAQTAPEAAAVPHLLVQIAEKVVLSGRRLELRGVAPATVWFAGGSTRRAGHLPTASFVTHWGKVRKSLPADALVATLSVLEPEEAGPVVLTLRNPMLKSGNLVYEAEVRSGPAELSGSGGTLFLDVRAPSLAPESVPGSRPRSGR